MKKQSLTFYLASLVKKMKSGGRYGTAHVYDCAMKSFSAFCGNKAVPFGVLTPECLKRYENHLRGAGKRENTVSTYLRMLKAAYRRAVREKIVEDYDPMLFSDVGTGYACRYQACHRTRCHEQDTQCRPFRTSQVASYGMRTRQPDVSFPWDVFCRLCLSAWPRACSQEAADRTSVRRRGVR